MACPMPREAPVTSATRPAWGLGSWLLAWHCPFSDWERMCSQESTAGFSTSWHQRRKLVGVEFSGVRRTALSRPSFLAQAMSVIPCAITSDMPKLTKRSL